MATLRKVQLRPRDGRQAGGSKGRRGTRRRMRRGPASAAARPAATAAASAPARAHLMGLIQKPQIHQPGMDCRTQA